MPRPSSLGFVSSFKDRRVPNASVVSRDGVSRKDSTVPCRSFVPDCSPIRAAGVRSFAEVRRGSYLGIRSAVSPVRSFAQTRQPTASPIRAAGVRSFAELRRGTCLAIHSAVSPVRSASPPPAPAPPAPSVPSSRVRSVSPPVPPSTGARQPLISLLRERRLARQMQAQDAPSTSEAPRSHPVRRYRTSEEPRAAPQAPPTSTRSAPSSRFDAVLQRVQRARELRRKAAEDAFVDSVYHSELQAIRLEDRQRWKGRIARMRARDGRPADPRLTPYAHLPSPPRESSAERAARHERLARFRARRRLEAIAAGDSTPVRPQTRLNEPLARRPANLSRQGPPSTPLPAPTRPRRTEISAARPVRAQRAIAPADDLLVKPAVSTNGRRQGKPAKRVRFGDVTVQPVSRWIVPSLDVFKPL